MSNKQVIKNTIKPKIVLDTLINNEYVVNLIYDRYIFSGVYKLVYEYIQSDYKCNLICKQEFFNNYDDYQSITKSDDDELIDLLIIKNNDMCNDEYRYTQVITIRTITDILTMDKSDINSYNKLNPNKWKIVQRLINNDYNKKPLYGNIMSNNNNNYLSSVLICGRCKQVMVSDSSGSIKNTKLRYYRCSNSVIPNKKTSIKDKPLIGCNSKNLIIDFINLVIIELLLHINVDVLKDEFMIKLFNKYQELFINSEYDTISRKIQRSFILIFVRSIEWIDIKVCKDEKVTDKQQIKDEDNNKVELDNELIIHLYDVDKVYKLHLDTKVDKYGILNDSYYVDDKLIKIDKYYLLN